VSWDVVSAWVTTPSLALAADPLRPSAEGAAPYGATSDALSCHPVVLPRELQLPRSPRAWPFFRWDRWLPAGSRIPAFAVGLARRNPKPRTPSIDSMLGLATEWSVCAIPVTFARNRPAPFRSSR
jgi:hypothetical protein